MERTTGPEAKPRFPVTFLAGAVVVLGLLAGIYLWMRSLPAVAPQAEPRLPFTPVEQSYAERIHFQNLSMSRAENFLHQEVTYLTGEIANGGTRTILDLQVTIEYRDTLDQVILRETRRPLGSRPVPLPGGRSREFQFGFEHIPDGWNHQVPIPRVTGLRLE